jgi:hypothetical protein
LKIGDCRDEIHEKSLGYNIGKITKNTDILYYLKITLIIEKINVHMSNWTNPVNSATK